MQWGARVYDARESTRRAGEPAACQQLVRTHIRLTSSLPVFARAGAADAEAEGDAAAGEKVAAGPAERAARLSERLEAALATRRANQHAAAGGVKRRADGEEVTTAEVDEPQPFNFECARQTPTGSGTLPGVFTTTSAAQGMCVLRVRLNARWMRVWSSSDVEQRRWVS